VFEIKISINIIGKKNFRFMISFFCCYLTFFIKQSS